MDTSAFPRPVQALLDRAKQLCSAHGVTLILSPERSVDMDGVEVNGYFGDEPAPTLACACGQETSRWVGILAHEMSHLEQWAEGSHYWTDAILENGADASDLLFGWVEGEMELSQAELDRCFEVIQGLEADCERRAHAKIKEMNLPIDGAEYAQKACAYIWFYSWVKEARAWYETGSEPYNLKEVWGKMPKEIPSPEDCAKGIPPEIRLALENHYGAPVKPEAPRVGAKVAL